MFDRCGEAFTPRCGFRGKVLSDNQRGTVMLRPRPIRTSVLALLGALALVAVPFTQSAQASASATYENSVYANTSIQRAKYDRAALRHSKCLDAFAERQA